MYATIEVSFKGEVVRVQEVQHEYQFRAIIRRIRSWADRKDIQHGCYAYVVSTEYGCQEYTQ